MQKILTKNKTVQKFISSLILICMLTPAIFLSFTPKKAEAQWVVWDPAHTAITVKIVMQEVARQFLMAIARALLARLTQSIVNWINSGHWGNPLYLENQQSFFKDIVKYEVRNLIDTFGYDSLRFPFGKSFALNTIDAYKRQLADNAQYSLSKVINDPVLLNNYRNDFSVGGWNGFLINTQYQQNNYIGFQMIATEALARELQGTVFNSAQEVQDTLQKGLGFLSPQTCLTNPEYNKTVANQFVRPSFTPTPFSADIPGLEYDQDGEITPGTQPIYDQAVRDWEGQNAAAKDTWTLSNTCPGGLTNTTPGSVVGNQIGTALESKIHNVELAAAMGNIIAAVLDTLMNKFMTSGGLNKLSNSISPQNPPTDIDSFTDTLGNSVNSLDSQSQNGSTGGGGGSQSCVQDCLGNDAFDSAQLDACNASCGN